MLLPCPHCQTDLDITPELRGQTVQCPACNGRLTIPAEEVGESISTSGKPKRSGWKEKDHANVNFGKKVCSSAPQSPLVSSLCCFPSSIRRWVRSS